MYLGIDLGTSEVKVVLLDEGGAIVASATAPLEVQRPQPRWSEQSAQSWWDASLAAVDKLKAQRPEALAAVKGLGLSGQMHGATLLDAADRPLRPAILWNDTRSADECKELEARVPALRKITGNLAFPGFTAPKLVWVERHEPQVFAKVKSVLLPKDYLRLRLTGEKVSEMSDAAGTLWLDVAKRDWSEPMLAGTHSQCPADAALGGIIRLDAAPRNGFSAEIGLMDGRAAARPSAHLPEADTCTWESIWEPPR